MTERREPTNRKAKSSAKETGGRPRLSAAQRRRRKSETDRRYYERYRSGCAVTAYLDSPEEKEALIEKLRPLGLTVSNAVKSLLRAVVNGQINLEPPPKKPE